MARSAVSSSRANRSGSRSASAGSTRAAAAGITSRMWLSALADPHAGPGYSQAAASWGRMHPRLHAPRIPSSSAHCSSASVTCAGDGVGTRYAVCYLGPREQPSRRGRCTYHVFTRLGHGVSVDAGARQETGTKSSCRASQAGGARCGRAARRSAARRGRMQGRGGRAKQALKQAAHNSCILARAAYTSCGAGRQLGDSAQLGAAPRPQHPAPKPAGRPACHATCTDGSAPPRRPSRRSRHSRRTCTADRTLDRKHTSPPSTRMFSNWGRQSGRAAETRHGLLGAGFMEGCKRLARRCSLTAARGGALAAAGGSGEQRGGGAPGWKTRWSSARHRQRCRVLGSRAYRRPGWRAGAPAGAASDRSAHSGGGSGRRTRGGQPPMPPAFFLPHPLRLLATMSNCHSLHSGQSPCGTHATNNDARRGACPQGRAAPASSEPLPAATAQRPPPATAPARRHLHQRTCAADRSPMIKSFTRCCSSAVRSAS